MWNFDVRCRFDEGRRLEIMHVKRRAAYVISVLLGPLCVCGAPKSAFALAFTPTEIEWSVWPEYCRARYVVSGYGRESLFASRVSQDKIDYWATQLGDGWGALHHYCAAIHKVTRAMNGSQSRRAFELKDAVADFQFYLSRTPAGHPLYASAAAQSCSAMDLAGDAVAADNYCQMAIQAQPDNSVGYTAKATVLRRHGRYQEAREVLEKGYEATKGTSAELNYFLGLACLDLKDFDSAKKYAVAAYKLGYPLPGLRQRLRESGHPID